MITLRTVDPNPNPEDIPGYSDPLRVYITNYVLNGWPFLFRKVVLPFLPVEQLAQLFCNNNGRPIKDLYTMAGLTVLQEFFNLTDEAAVDRLMTDFGFQVALGLNEATDENLYITIRTYINFRSRLVSSPHVDAMFKNVTKELIKQFNVDTRIQRIDSVHLSSNMKKAGRLVIMSTTVEKFLKWLRKSEPTEFEALDPKLVATYLPDPSSGCKCFGFSIAPSERENAMMGVGLDIFDLVNKFQSHPTVSEASAYKLLARVLNEQFNVKVDGRLFIGLKSNDEVNTEADRELGGFWEDESESGRGLELEIKNPKDVSSESLQFPTDPDCSYSAHKGKGYQAQICETVVLSDDPEVKKENLSLITYVEVEGAAKSDAAALKPAIDQLEENDLKPEEILADTSYGGQDNFNYAAGKDIKLVAPVPGKEGTPKVGGEKNGYSADEAQEASFYQETISEPEAFDEETEQYDTETTMPLRLSDFDLDDDGEIKGCPMGVERLDLTKSGENMKVYFPRCKCAGCPRRMNCPVTLGKKQAWLCYKKDDLVSSRRRAWQKTKEFKDKYRWRSGIEGTNSFLARLGLKKLSVRGHEKVSFKTKLKALAVNIRRTFSFILRNREKYAMI
jgi:hypothetical protein